MALRSASFQSVEGRSQLVDPQGRVLSTHDSFLLTGKQIQTANVELAAALSAVDSSVSDFPPSSTSLFSLMVSGHA